MEGVPGTRLDRDGSLSPAVMDSVTETVIDIHAALRKPVSRYGAERHRNMIQNPLEMLAAYSCPAP